MEEKLAESREKDRMKDWGSLSGCRSQFLGCSQVAQEGQILGLPGLADQGRSERFKQHGPSPVGRLFRRNGVKAAVTSGRLVHSTPHPAAKGALDGRKACIHTFFTHTSLRLPRCCARQGKAVSGTGDVESGQLEFKLSLVSC